jgi:hypothetical protein
MSALPSFQPSELVRAVYFLSLFQVEARPHAERILAHLGAGLPALTPASKRMLVGALCNLERRGQRPSGRVELGQGLDPASRLALGFFNRDI